MRQTPLQPFNSLQNLSLILKFWGFHPPGFFPSYALGLMKSWPKYAWPVDGKMET